MRPLHDAIMRDNLEGFGELVENSDIERENRVGYTPLQLAVMLDRFDMASILLAHGANTDKELLDIGILPLHCSVLEENFRMTELLLESGVDPNSKAPNGALSLQLSENPEMIMLLVQRGADIKLARQAKLEQMAAQDCQKSRDVLMQYTTLNINSESHAESSSASHDEAQKGDTETSFHVSTVQRTIQIHHHAHKGTAVSLGRDYRTVN